MTDPIKDLLLLRAAYVQRRRLMARQSAESGQNNSEPFANLSWMQEFGDIQKAIEVIDVAIAEEKEAAHKATSNTTTL